MSKRRKKSGERTKKSNAVLPKSSPKKMTWMSELGFLGLVNLGLIALFIPTVVSLPLIFLVSDPRSVYIGFVIAVVAEIVAYEVAVHLPNLRRFVNERLRRPQLSAVLGGGILLFGGSLLFYSHPCSRLVQTPALVNLREVLVLISPFEQISGNPIEPHREWKLVLDQVKQEFSPEERFDVVQIPQMIHNHDDARRISDCYQATLVIWGTVQGAAIETNYTTTPRWSFASSPSQSRVQGTLDELRLYVSPGGDSIYIVNMILGQLYYYSGNFPLALKHLNSAIQLIPAGREQEMGGHSVYFYRGIINSGQENDLEAVDDFSKAIEIAPEIGEYYNARGAVYYGLYRSEEALLDLNHAIEVLDDTNTSYIFARGNRAGVYTLLEDYESALSDYNYVIQTTPYGHAYAGRANMYIKMGKYEQAVVDANQAIVFLEKNFQSPADPKYYAILGDAYYLWGRENDALANYRRYVEMMGDNADDYVLYRIREMETLP